MALSEPERIIVQAQLDEARVVLHRVVTGQQEVSLAYNGESVTYSVTNLADLRSHIRDLEAMLGIRAFARARSRGVVFG